MLFVCYYIAFMKQCIVVVALYIGGDFLQKKNIGGDRQGPCPNEVANYFLMGRMLQAPPALHPRPGPSH
jgi:hypothetical protein